MREQIVQSLISQGVSKIYYIEYDFQVEKNPLLKNDNILYYIYDLSVSPLNYEYIAALCLAEIKRIEVGASFVHPIIIQPNKKGLYDMSRDALTGAHSYVEKDNYWFLYNVILLGAGLLPSTRGVTLCHDKEEAKKIVSEINDQWVYPEKSLIDSPKEFKIMPNIYTLANKVLPAESAPLRSEESSLQFVDQWLVENKIDSSELITITLRESSYASERNSNISVWLEVARKIKSRGYTPVFVRDTHSDFMEREVLNGYIVFHEASWNVLLRMAFYERAYLNMSVNTGTLHLCQFNSCANYLGFIYLSNNRGASVVGSKNYVESEGISIGAQYGGAGEFQKLIWGGNNDLNVIVSEFDLMCDKIKRKFDA
jgi:hypothetical protein